MADTDVTNLVQACRVCAQAKASHQLPVGLLEPLPVPQRPWSHVALDFVTDLPSSQGHTTILVAVDRFSKACRLVPLKGLPTAWETAMALFTQGRPNSAFTLQRRERRDNMLSINFQWSQANRLRGALWVVTRRDRVEIFSTLGK